MSKLAIETKQKLAVANLEKKIENSIQPGSVNIFTGIEIPVGWSLCDGAPLNKLTYPELYRQIGDAFGSSEHEFSKPDFRGKCPIGAGNGVGLTNHLLTVSELPSHDHPVIDPYMAFYWRWFQ